MVTSHELGDKSEWVSLSEAARRTGVSTASVCRKVKGLEQAGLLTSRFAGNGGARLVNIDEFIRAQERTRDVLQTAKSRLATPARERRKAEASERVAEAPRRRARADYTPDLQEEQARRTRADADLKELQLKQKRDELIETIAVREAMATAGGAIARGLETLKAKIPEIASCVAKDGEAGLRVFVNGFIREMRGRIASELRTMGRAADEADEAP